MLRELLMNILFTCFTIIVVVVTLAVLKLFFGYMFKVCEEQEKSLASIDEPAASNVVRRLESGESDDRKSYEKSEKSRFVPKLEGEEVIECGNCGKPITSECLEVKKSDNSPEVHIYECEHCGAKVGVH